MRAQQSYLEQAKTRALSGAPPRAASPFEWEEWYRYSGQNGRSNGGKSQTRLTGLRLQAK